jgi:redox-sensitive bicupin YhaK (pirin superfamily)
MMKLLKFSQQGDQMHWVGDGFPVQSVFSYGKNGAAVSPFLLMDYAAPQEFGPSDHVRGVGEHPHRGFETVTIVYAGEVEHRDSHGGGGAIGPGDVQWMTAGAGLVHQEYHGKNFARTGGPFEMIQLWVNLPKAHKMTKPRYQEIKDAQIPRVELPEGAGYVRVIAGDFGAAKGAAATFSPVNLWDVRLNAGSAAKLALPRGQNTNVFVLAGSVKAGGVELVAGTFAGFDAEGDELALSATTAAKLLILAGEPIKEPIVGYGPFVMNTVEEIHQAIDDFNNGRMGRIAN